MNRLKHHRERYSQVGTGLGTRDPVWVSTVPKEDMPEVREAIETPPVDPQDVAEEKSVDSIVCNEFEL